jgi:hypothetical protein
MRPTGELLQQDMAEIRSLVHFYAMGATWKKFAFLLVMAPLPPPQTVKRPCHEILEHI